MPGSTRGCAMRESPAGRRGLVVGSILLAALAALALAAPWLVANGPEVALDPATTALARPLSRFVTLPLVDGRTLAAEQVGRTDDAWRLIGPTKVREVPVDQVSPEAEAGEVRFWLGADALGRDVAARWLQGARISLAVAAASVALALLIGLPVGLVAGLLRGTPARLLLAGLETAQAFPRLFLLAALAALLPRGTVTTVAVLGLTGWMPLARLVRAETRRLRAAEFVTAARAAGLTGLQLARRHLVPNLAAPIVVEASLSFGAAITTESALSFLGFGVPPPVASWGSLIAEGRDLVPAAWWIALFPGLGLVAAGLGSTLVGEGLRARLDRGGRAATR